MKRATQTGGIGNACVMLNDEMLCWKGESLALFWTSKWPHDWACTQKNKGDHSSTVSDRGTRVPSLPLLQWHGPFLSMGEYLALFSADLPPALDPTRGCRAVWSCHAVSSKDFGAAIGHCANITAAGVARWSGMISPIDLCLPRFLGILGDEACFVWDFASRAGILPPSSSSEGVESWLFSSVDVVGLEGYFVDVRMCVMGVEALVCRCCPARSACHFRDSVSQLRSLALR